MHFAYRVAIELGGKHLIGPITRVFVYTWQISRESFDGSGARFAVSKRMLPFYLKFKPELGLAQSVQILFMLPFHERAISMATSSQDMRPEL